MHRLSVSVMAAGFILAESMRCLAAAAPVQFMLMIMLPCIAPFVITERAGLTGLLLSSCIAVGILVPTTIVYLNSGWFGMGGRRCASSLQSANELKRSRGWTDLISHWP